MPTGYTSDLYEGNGITFPDFVLKCARAFGALIEMRDDSMDATIPDKFEASRHYAEQLEKAEADVARINAWDDTEADHQAQLAYDRALREYEKSLINKTTMRERYETMLAQVKAWTPPTSEHQELKNFMVEQLETSISFDCDTKYLTIPKRLTGSAYKEEQLRSARWNVSYSRKENEAAEKRAEERTNWVNALRQSLVESSSAVIGA